MKTLIFTLFISFSFGLFSQKNYGFDIPVRAKSNEHILDWYLDNLDSNSNIALCNLLDATGVNQDSINWVYTTNIRKILTDYGQNFYSLKIYSTTNKTKNVEVSQIYVSNNKLENKTYLLFYSEDDKTKTVSLSLMEYY